MSQVDFSRYLTFVNEVTSQASSDTDAFVYRVQELKGEGCDIQRLMTAAVGVCAEGGEFMEIVKKMAFQGKPYNEDNVFHMKRELGDIMWYLAQACIALDVSFEQLVEMNVEKLEARYPGGSFDVHYSENRKEGDL
jgi:NTP pyrophosphatase (non-canonical NTP hydrolase)